MATIGAAGVTGNADIDGLLMGARWLGGVSYSFPTAKGVYPAGYGMGEPSDPSFGPISAAQKAVFHKAAQDVASFTNLTISYQARSAGADLLIAQSAVADPTAYTYVLGVSDAGGDIWFGTTFNWRDPKLGDYFHYAHIHEFGHALGLKHGHEISDAFPMMPVGHDGHEFTVMSYRSYIGASSTLGLTNEDYGFPSTYMISDIRALQQLYGANFSARGGNTVYSWSPATGEAFIDGVGQGRPGGANAGPAANVIFMSVWDGGGQDTYDFSNYTKAVTVNLNPGAASVASKPQLAALGDGHIASANVYNAYLFNGDARSYIENAKGGRGNDYLLGNAAANRLEGGAGNDKLVGGAGADQFVFGRGQGRDTINDFQHGVDKIVFSKIGRFDDFADLKAHGHQVGSHVIFTFEKNLSLTLRYNSLTGLSADDFVFPPDRAIARTHAPVAVSGKHAESAAGSSSASPAEPPASAHHGEPASTAAADEPIWSVEDPGGAIIIGTSGRDIINAARTVRGQPLATDEADNIRTGAGKDTVHGGGGNDNIDGGAGDDILYGEDGNDWLRAGPGTDRLYGGAGSNVYVITDDMRGDVVTGGEGRDEIAVSGFGGVTLSRFNAAYSKIDAWSGSDVVNGTAGNDLLDFNGLKEANARVAQVDAGAGNDKVAGTAWADDLRGGAGDDAIFAHEGADHLGGGAGADTLDGGAGDDIVLLTGSEGVGDVIRGGAGNDTLDAIGSEGLMLSRFNAGASSVEILQTAFAPIRGTDGNDSLDFSALRRAVDFSTIEGGAGNDRLTGHFGTNVIRGGDGDDAINGASGNDILWGDRGNDRFVFNPGFGSDFVFDFEEGPGGDVIAVSGAVLTDFTSLLAASRQQVNDVIIETGGNRLHLPNTALENLQASDFYFF